MITDKWPKILGMDAVPTDRARAVVTRVARERLGPTVRKLAAQRGLSLTRLAKNVGYGGVNGLLDAINGRSDIPLSRLFLIAGELQVWSLEELFGPSGTTEAIGDLTRPPSG